MRQHFIADSLSGKQTQATSDNNKRKAGIMFLRGFMIIITRICVSVIISVQDNEEHKKVLLLFDICYLLKSQWLSGLTDLNVSTVIIFNTV